MRDAPKEAEEERRPRGRGLLSGVPALAAQIWRKLKGGRTASEPAQMTPEDYDAAEPHRGRAARCA